MPNRILRDWTDSYTVEPLSAEGERLFVRLIMKADDFGRYHADPRLIRAGCFPLLNNLRDTDIARWIAECEKAGLIAVYKSSGRSYLAIVNFKQRTRADESKFPPPDGQPKDWRPGRSGQLAVTCQTDDGQVTAKTETYSKTKTGAETALRAPPDSRSVGTSNGAVRYPLPNGDKLPKPLFPSSAVKLIRACDEQIEIVRSISKKHRTPLLGKTPEGTEVRTGWKYPKEAEEAIAAWEARKSEINKALAG